MSFQKGKMQHVNHYKGNFLKTSIEKTMLQRKNKFTNDKKCIIFRHNKYGDINIKLFYEMF